MAKLAPVNSNHSLPPGLRKPRRKLPIRAILLTVLRILLVVVVIGAILYVLPPELPWFLQRLLAAVVTALVVLAYVYETREKESTEEMYRRLSRGQHTDFGKRLRSDLKKRHDITLPLVGKVTFRLIGGVVVGMLVFVWWLTPIAPVIVERVLPENLTVPLANEIMAAVLVTPDGELAVLQTPVVPAEARRQARRVSKNVNPYHLGLKAIAEGRFEDARELFAEALKIGEVDPGLVYLARGQNEIYANRFADGAIWFKKALDEKPGDPEIMCQAAVGAMYAGSYRLAEPMVMSAVKLADANAIKNENEFCRAACYHIWAMLCIGNGQGFDKAQSLNQKASKIWADAFGDDHPYVAASISNRSLVCQLRGDWTGAIGQSSWARQIWSRTLGKKHPHVSDSLGNLAMLYFVRGKLEKAREINEGVLQARRDVLPVGHPGIAIALNTTAVLETYLAQYEEADQLVQEAFSGIKSKLGEQNACMAGVLNTLGKLHMANARFKKAEQCFSQAIATTKMSLSAEHPYLATCLLNSGELYLAQGQLDQAEKLANQAIALAKRAFGREHPCIARSMVLQGKIKIARKRPREARPDLEKALKMREQTLGKEHPLVAESLGLVASLNDSPTTYKKGVDGFKKAIVMDEQFFDETHPAVADLKFGLAKLYVKRNKYVEAEKYLKQVWKARKETLDPTHPDLATTLDVYAELLRSKKTPDVNKAKKVQAQARAIRKKHAEVDLPD